MDTSATVNDFLHSIIAEVQVDFLQISPTATLPCESIIMENTFTNMVDGFEELQYIGVGSGIHTGGEKAC